MKQRFSPCLEIFNEYIDNLRHRMDYHVTFLEVKDRPSDEVGPIEIDAFVGKMIRGGADEGVFAATYFKKSVKSVVKDHNVQLAKWGKNLRLKQFFLKKEEPFIELEID